jgi:murein DD-endopeptidase MepM/ murein hydrolase activator NlpD
MRSDRPNLRLFLAIMFVAFLLFVSALIVTPVRAQELSAGRVHEVQIGDTWKAIAYQYGIEQDELLSANRAININRQPAVGSQVLIPISAETTPEMGKILAMSSAGSLYYSLLFDSSPWKLAIANYLRSPVWLSLNQSIVVPDQTSIPRELPAGIDLLEFMEYPLSPGKIAAFRVEFDHPISLTAYLDDQEFIVSRSGASAVGTIGTGAFFAPGAHHFAIEAAGSAIWMQPVLFEPGQWTYEQITLTGTAAQIDQQSIQEEWERLSEIWSQVTPGHYWDGTFQLPIEEFLEYSSLYGAHRSYNGGPYRSYHEGVDFAALGGSPVLAPAAGRIVLAEELYVRGGAVLIDHGSGIYSGVYHMSEILVQVGDMVEKGEMVGRVGSTGLSTGNHLHWDLLVGGVQVDGQDWLDRDAACWLLTSLDIPCPTE